MKPTTFKLTALIGLAMVYGGTLAVGASAGTNPQGRQSVQVDYTDLDLTRTADAQTLYRRISQAADQVCARPSPRELRLMQRYRQCYDEAVADAVDKVNVTTLTALHRSRTLRPLS